MSNEGTTTGGLRPLVRGRIDISGTGKLVLPAEAPLTTEQILEEAGIEAAPRLLRIDPKVFVARPEFFRERVIEFFEMPMREFTAVQAIRECSERGLLYAEYEDCLRVLRHDPNRQVLRPIMFPHLPVLGKRLILTGGREHGSYWRALYAVNAFHSSFGEVVAGLKI